MHIENVSGGDEEEDQELLSTCGMTENFSFYVAETNKLDFFTFALLLS